MAILLDPVIATGNTAIAAVETLFEWGVERVVVLGVVGSVEGVGRVAGLGTTATAGDTSLDSGREVEGGGTGREIRGEGSAGREAREGQKKPRVEIWIGAVDEGGEGGSGLDADGWVRPGLGDVGDRLFMTG